MEVVLISIVLVGISFLILGVRIFFVKGGNFPETEVGTNRNMRQLGITCVKCDESKRYREAVRKRAAKNINPSFLKLDVSGLGSKPSGNAL